MRTPLLFVGHGNPMNAISDNIYSRMWEKIGKSLAPPKAIVCFSAHWLTSGSFVTCKSNPEIIYDFYGFPEELYNVKYPVAGDEHLAKTISQTEKTIRLDTKWGIDHGTWSVLKRMFPKANIPVLQISVDYSAPPEIQFELIKKLKGMREEGILFIGSGNIVHNLPLAAMNSKPYDWAIEFEEICRKLIEKKDFASLIHYEQLGASSRLAVPTDDHYRPMLNTLALAYEDEEPSFFNRGIDLGSVSMLSFIMQTPGNNPF